MLRGLLGGFARGRRQTSAATLVLDFLAGLNDSRITYSGGANGTRVNSSGNIVAATTPRFDYDPVTLAAKGLLVEEARTNLALRSEDFTNAAWLTAGTATVTANTTVSPDGTQDADTVTANLADSIIYQQIVVSASTTYTGSFYMKAATNTTVTIYILTGAFAALGSQVCNVTTQWQRFSVTAATGVNTLVLLSIGGGASFSSPEAVIPWGAQLEAGAFPTSYIPTTSASVTRTADSAVMTGTNFSSWYNQSEGTFVVKASSLNVTTYKPLIQVDSALTERIFLDQSSGAMRLNAVNAGVNDIVITLATVSANTPFTEGATYKVNDYAAALNGAAPVVDTSGLVPVTNTFRIGSDSVNRWNGHIQTIQYFPRRSANSQLQAMTA